MTGNSLRNVLFIYLLFSLISDDDHSSNRCFEYLIDDNNESTPLPLPWTFLTQPHGDNNIAAASTQDEETLLYQDLYDDLATVPLKNLDDDSGMMIIPHKQLQQLEVEEEINIEVLVCLEEEKKEAIRKDNIDIG